MNSARLYSILTFAGIMIAIASCFLPWAKLGPSYFHPWSETKAGISIFLGIYTFITLVFTAFFQLLYVIKGKIYIKFLVLIGGLFALAFANIWVLEPGTFEVTQTLYSALYGAYVTLLGSVIISVGTILSLTTAAEKAILSSNSI